MKIAVVFDTPNSDQTPADHDAAMRYALAHWDDAEPVAVERAAQEVLQGLVLWCQPLFIAPVSWDDGVAVLGAGATLAMRA